jgi:hypothetical protein
VVVNEEDIVRKVAIARGKWPANVAVDTFEKPCGMVRSFVWEWEMVNVCTSTNFARRV